MNTKYSNLAERTKKTQRASPIKLEYIFGCTINNQQIPLVHRLPLAGTKARAAGAATVAQWPIPPRRKLSASAASWALLPSCPRSGSPSTYLQRTNGSS